MTVKMTLTKEFLDGYTQTTDTAIMNLTDMVVVEMKKLAPFANPGQYKYGYRGNPGSLVKSLHRIGKGKKTKIVSNKPYAIRRNYENNLNPQTKNYIDRALANILRGKTSQWWRAS